MGGGKKAISYAARNARAHPKGKGTIIQKIGVRLRFQADADLHPAIGRGFKRRAPAINFQLAQGIIPDATPDPEVLGFSAEENRVLVSQDTRTMPSHFASFVATHSSPGLILVPSSMSIGSTIEGLYFAWLRWSAEEIANQMRWLPRLS